MDHPSPTPSPTGGNSFLSPAKIRILLAPVPDVHPAQFDQWCRHVRNFESIPLSHLPATNNRSAPPPDSPLAALGEVHLSFVTSYDPAHAFLAPFSLHKHVLGVLGLTTFNHHSDRDALQRSPSALRELHPGAIVHRVFAFDNTAANPPNMDLSVLDHPANANANASTPSSAPAGMPRSASASSIPSDASLQGGFSGRNAGGLVIFPAVRKDAKDVNFYLRTLISELVASIIDGLDSIVSGLEGTPLETPRETLENVASPFRPNTSSPSAVTSPSSSSLAAGVGTAASTAASRASALFSSFGGGGGSSSNNSNSSSSGVGGGGMTNSTSTSSGLNLGSQATRPASAIGGGLQPDLVLPPIAAASSPTSLADAKRRTILSSASAKKGKKTTSVGGVGPTGSGRFAKVRADYSLLSGDLWAALEGYHAALGYMGKERALAGGQDAVWYASALEGWAVAKVLVLRMGGEVLERAPAFELPTTAAAASAKEKDKDKDKEAKDGPFYAKQPWSDIAEAYSLALTIYAKCLAPPHVLLEPARSVTNETPRDFTHPLIHAGACIQYARFLLAVWASGGWNSECFDQLVYGGVPPALAEETRPSQATFLRLSAVSGVQRHDIACAASSALTQSVAALKATDRIAVLCTLTSIFGCIGFTRREAYLLRQLQAVIVSLLAKSIAQRPQQPVTTTLPLLCDPGEDEVLGTMVSQLSNVALGSGSEAVLVLAMQVCETHGIHVEVDPLRNMPPHHILSRAGTGLRSAYASPNPNGGAPGLWTGEAGKPLGTMLSRLELEGEVPFGWPEQQTALLKDTIGVAEMLGDNVGMAFFAAILLRDFYPLLSAEEQWRAYQGLMRTTASARWQGAQGLQVKYWGPAEPLCSLQFVPLQGHRLPSERPAWELEAPAKTASTEGVAGLDNPFFWNPASRTASMYGGGAGNKDSVVVVADEPLEVVATLQNPFAIDLDVESVKLVVEGVEFEPNAARTTMPGGSFHTLRLSGTAKGAGTLKVKGVSLVLAGCCEETFLLPVFDEQSQKEQQNRAADASDRRARIKHVGLDARPAVVKHREALALAEGAGRAKRRTASHRPQAEPRYLECRVAPAQPLLRAECASLRYGTLHLFEGERKRIRLRLTNLSDKVAIHYVKLSFSDNLSELAKQVLVEGDLLPSDAHELEWDLLNRPVLRLRAATTPATTATTATDKKRSPHRLYIAPLATETAVVEVVGKLDCSSARIVVEYASLEGVGSAASDKFFTRQLTVPLSITVQPLLECSPMEVRPLRADEAARLTAQSLATSVAAPAFGAAAAATSPVGEEQSAVVVVEEQQRQQEEGADDGGEAKLVEANVTADPEAFCLVSLDVRNVYTETVTVRFELNTGGLRPLQLHRRIKPLTTSRFVLPCPRLLLSSEASAQPIPSLSSRQFIVSKVALSPHEEAAARRRFWYRQELLARLGAEWLLAPSVGERGTKRGQVDLRDQVLQDSDVQALKRELVKVDLEVGEVEDGSTRQGKASEATREVQSETFVKMRISIANYAARPLKLLVRIIAVSPTSSLGASRVPAIAAAGAGTDKGEKEREEQVQANVVWADGHDVARVRPWPLAPSRAEEEGRAEAVVEKSLMFLAKGEYGFLACVQEVEEKGKGEEREKVEYVSSLPVVVVVV
ncbi:hypothetical protein ACQY0O_006022 [Thecaphora frezii]